MKSAANSNPMDFRAYEATPGLSVIVRADASVFTIVSVSNDFVATSGLKRQDLIGKGIFGFLAMVPAGCLLAEENLLRESFENVVRHKRRHQIPLLRFDGRTAEEGSLTTYWQVTSAPILDESGSIEFIVSTAVDRTAQVRAEEKLRLVKGIERAYQFFMNAPVIIGYVRGDDYVIELANDRLLKVWGRTSEVVGKPLLKAIPELEGQGIKKLLDDVRKTGVPFFAYELPLTFDHDGKTETLYFDFVYEPFYENERDPVAAGVISVGHDVTEQVKARQRFTNIIEQASDPILILKGPDMVLEVANQALFDLWRIDGAAIGKPFLTILPEMKDQGFFDLLKRVYDSGQPYHGYEVPAVFEDGRTVYFNFTYQPYREPNGEISGVLVTAFDATPQVLAKKEILESNAKWKDIANSMPAIVWTTDSNRQATFFNNQWYDFTGLREEESIQSGWLKAVHPEDVDRCLDAWNESTRRESLYMIELRYKNRDGDYRWLISKGIPIKREGKVIAWYGTSTEIHQQKELELYLEEKVRERTEELESKNKLLDNILTHSSNGIAVSEMVHDQSGNVVDAFTIVANDSAVKFSGIPKELYLSKPATAFDPNIISSPYGQACLRTLRTGEPSVMQYFIEYSSKWLELTISRMDDTHLIHIFTDVTPIKEAQLQLEKSLHDLKVANSNLEEFAYVASHDLKEPVRKVLMFCSRLKEPLKEKLDVSHMELFERLEKASVRMQNLIDDLLEYSVASRGAAEQKKVDLAITLKNVLEDLEFEIEKKQAQVVCASLPEVTADPRQMQQLFQNLISNALKYTRAVPKIMVTSKITVKEDLPHELQNKQFHLIEVNDNGIGFEQKHAESVFKIFTRLQTSVDYSGTGIGLSIVKKIVENHNGFVWAESEPGKGSTFKILLPC